MQNKNHNTEINLELEAQQMYIPVTEKELQFLRREKKVNNNFFFIVLLTIIISIFCSCKKDDAASNNTVCYTCYDDANNFVQLSCGANEQQAFEASAVINGVHTIENFRKHCRK